MKEYLEKRREELRKENGFTLMEMLIVVAIIAILIAIAIPVFSSQLERAREAADIANIRSAYAEAMGNYMTAGPGGTASATSEKMTQANGSAFEYIEWPSYLGTQPSTVTQNQPFTVSIDASGNVTCTQS